MFKFKSNKRKFRKWVFVTFLMFFAICLVVQIVSIHVNISKKQQELNVIREKVDIQTHQNQLLQKQLSFGVTDEYIAELARKKLNLVLPSERIFIDVTKE